MKRKAEQASESEEFWIPAKQSKISKEFSGLTFIVSPFVDSFVNDKASSFEKVKKIIQSEDGCLETKTFKQIIADLFRSSDYKYVPVDAKRFNAFLNEKVFEEPEGQNNRQLDPIFGNDLGGLSIQDVMINEKDNNENPNIEKDNEKVVEKKEKEESEDEIDDKEEESADEIDDGEEKEAAGDEIDENEVGETKMEVEEKSDAAEDSEEDSEEEKEFTKGYGLEENEAPKIKLVTCQKDISIAFEWLKHSLKETPVDKLLAFFSLAFLKNWNKTNEYFEKKHPEIAKNLEHQLYLWYILESAEKKRPMICAEKLMSQQKMESLIGLKSVDAFQRYIILESEEKKEAKQKMREFANKNFFFWKDDNLFLDFKLQTAVFITNELLKKKKEKYQQEKKKSKKKEQDFIQFLKSDPFFTYISRSDYDIVLFDTKKQSITHEADLSSQFEDFVDFREKNAIFDNLSFRMTTRNCLHNEPLMKEKQKILNLQISNSKNSFGALPSDMFYEIVPFLEPYEIVRSFSAVNKSFRAISCSDSFWKDIVKRKISSFLFFRVQNEEMFDSLNEKKLPWMLFYRQFVQPLLLDFKMLSSNFERVVNTRLLESHPELAGEWEIKQSVFQKLLRIGLLLIPTPLNDPKEHVLGDHKFGDYPDFPKSEYMTKGLQELQNLTKKGKSISVLQLNCAKLWENSFIFSHFIMNDDDMLGKDFTPKTTNDMNEKKKNQAEKNDYSDKRIKEFCTRSFPKQGMMYFMMEPEDCEWQSYWYVNPKENDGKQGIEQCLELANSKKMKKPTLGEFGKLCAVQTFEALYIPRNYHLKDYITQAIVWKSKKFSQMEQAEREKLLDNVFDDAEFEDADFEHSIGSGHRMFSYDNPIQDTDMQDYSTDQLLLEVDSDDQLGFCFGDCGSLYCIKKKDDNFKPGSQSQFGHEFQCS